MISLTRGNDSLARKKANNLKTYNHCAAHENWQDCQDVINDAEGYIEERDERGCGEKEEGGGLYIDAVQGGKNK